MKLKYTTIITSILLAVFTSCATIKPKGASRSGGKLFETFYLGEKGTQYFIKPLKFSNGEEELLIDFTLQENEETAFVNYSIIGNTQTKEISSFLIESLNAKSNLGNSKKLYSERKKELVISRFSSEIPKSDLKTLFNNPNWNITINKLTSFTPISRTQKSISAINSHVFSLLNTN